MMIHWPSYLYIYPSWTDILAYYTDRITDVTVGPYQSNWDEYLAMAEFVINNAWNQSIYNTPFMLNCGQNPDTPEVVALRSMNPAVNKFGKWSEQLNRAKRCLDVTSVILSV
jgi:hypothetical protein